MKLLTHFIPAEDETKPSDDLIDLSAAFSNSGFKLKFFQSCGLWSVLKAF